MTFAKRKRLSLERVAEEIAREAAATAYPAGCVCKTSTCKYCGSFSRVYRRVLYWLKRLPEMIVLNDLPKGPNWVWKHVHESSESSKEGK